MNQVKVKRDLDSNGDRSKGKRTKPPSISACMMVKNEQELLPQCLESIKDFVDEIVIVDTGSNDRTVEIAESYGASVYHHPWENDFSKHRNQSISYATSDWIFVIDADEELVEGSSEIIKSAVEEYEVDSLVVTVVNYMNNRMSQAWTNQVRFFRNQNGICYQGRVHNRLVGYSSSRTCPIYLYHYGYDLATEKREAKFARTSSLLKKQIEAEPNVFRHRHDMAACYLANQMYEEATLEGVKALEMAMKSTDGQEELIPWTHFIVAFSYLKLGDLNTAERYARMALQAFPEHLDSHFILINICHEFQDWNPLEYQCNRYLDIAKELRKNPVRFGNIMHNSVNEEWRVHLALGDLFLERKQNKRANEEFRKAFSFTPNPSECHKIVGNFYLARASWELAERHFKSAILKNSDYPDAWLGLARVYKSLKKYDEYRDCADRLKTLKSEDTAILREIGDYDLRFGRFKSAIEYFKKILEHMPDDSDAHINLALAYKYEGMTENAERHNLRALELRGDSVEALSNLGHLYYEATRFDKAKEMYVQAIQLEKNLVDIHVRLANIYLLDGEIEKCVKACDYALRALSLPLNRTLHDMGDLAELFFLIGSGLKQAGKNQLSQEARQTGNLLRQIQGQQSSSLGVKNDSKLQLFSQLEV